MHMRKIFETKRLFLRKLTPNDVDALLEFFADADAMKYLPATKDIDGVKEWISLVQKSYDHYGYGPWALICKFSDQFLGYCGLCLQEDVDGKDEIEILYGLVRKNWGKGYATEAAIGVYEYGKNKLELNRFVALIEPGNIRSIKIAEKIGMQLENNIDRWCRNYRVYSIGI
jgi:[ribosomal protein S5]-alanine N-acetyltransferase